jgi:hypothetical protein
MVIYAFGTLLAPANVRRSLKAIPRDFYLLVGLQIASSLHRHQIRIYVSVTLLMPTNVRRYCAMPMVNAIITIGRKMNAAVTSDSTVMVWDVSTGQCTAILEAHDVFRFEFGAGNTLRTNRGVFDISIGPRASADDSSACQKYAARGTCGFNPANTWITYQGRNVLWLPVEFRPAHEGVIAACGTTIAIGCFVVPIWIIKFSDEFVPR